MFTTAASWIDALAMLNLLVCWLGYTLYAIARGKHSLCLATMLARYRREWMLRLLERENRIADASLLYSLRSSVSFFASTSILIIAGLITGIAASDEAVSVLLTLPFMTANTRDLWELKVLVMLVIFVYSFFEFTWSLRLYNFTCVMVGAAPLTQEVIGRTKDKCQFSNRTGQVMTLASRHFNYGLRSYYFALATIVWFINPLLFMGSTFLVVFILYRREFHSLVLDSPGGEENLLFRQGCATKPHTTAGTSIASVK